ncbi:MAG: A24 family peptidase C-terminal domain-containing protein [Nitrososphaerota archaeon]
MEIFDVYLIRIVLAVVMLAIASVLDVWKRQIHDGLWVVFGAIGAILIFFESDIGEISIKLLISLIIAPVAVILWRVGMFGGADSFSLIVLAVLTPQITLTENFITPLTTLTNATLLSTVILLINFTRNSIAVLNHKDIFSGFNESKLRKICAMFLGYRAANPKYSFPIERTEEDHKKLDFAIHHAEKSEFCNAKNTWVTPGIPLIIYITAGVGVQLLFGDVVINSLTTIL